MKSEFGGDNFRSILLRGAEREGGERMGERFRKARERMRQADRYVGITFIAAVL